MHKIWLFGAGSWQGNPKALFLYMNKYHPNRELWWIADTEEQAEKVRRLGFRSVAMNSTVSANLFGKADVYVVENFRERLPASINPNIVILNLWHGVGLKHVEYGVDLTSGVTESIAKKYIRNFKYYRNNMLFVATSKAMEEHFCRDMRLKDHQIVRAVYPRNVLNKDKSLETYKKDSIEGRNLADYSRRILFSPTYRDQDMKGSFLKLFPDMNSLLHVLSETNSLLIFKLHPFMTSDPGFLATKAAFGDHPNLLFWDNDLDVYELFGGIDAAIVDYSSIFYDLMDSGVERFIRYVPDFEAYTSNRNLTHDYFDYTDGVIAKSFGELLAHVSGEIPKGNKINELKSYFFGYSNGDGEKLIEEIIARAEQYEPQKTEWPTLYTYDIFDTLIRRKTLEPKSIFFAVQDVMGDSQIAFPRHLQKNYPRIRMEAEADLREVHNKTVLERGTEKTEITFSGIFDRIANAYSLNPEQIKILMDAEIEAEIASVEPIHHHIDDLLRHLEEGSDVFLVSDMYLPEDVIRTMLRAADPRISDLRLYLSTSVGHRKSTGKLFTHIFFDLEYEYASWVHTGDNRKGDGIVPERLGITTRVHDMDSHLPFEQYLVKSLDSFDGYRIATMLHRYRWSKMDASTMSSDDIAYYSYAYIGMYFVPYVNWVLKDAIRRGYKSIYFISRDGHYLKKIADLLIQERQYNIKSKFLYGSRRAWRVPSLIDEVDDASFSNFGLFGSLETVEQWVSASELPEDEVLKLVPALESYRNSRIDKSAAEVLRGLFKNSAQYSERLLSVAEEKRKIVRKYLRQEIDFDEPFACVEFWGRGYTQDALTRLLKDAAGREVDNPFYYVRNYTENSGRSIRHRFTVMPANFSFLEPIFATTPYESISGYEEQGEVVSPILRPLWNEYEEKISAGIERFAQDYLRLNVRNEDTVDRELAEAAYRYHIANPGDPFISNVYGNFEYSEASHGSVREFAPPLAAEVVLATPLAELSKLTGSIPISLSRSTPEARKAYELRKQIEGIYSEKVSATKPKFPLNSLARYVRTQSFPQKMVAIQPIHFYSNVDLRAVSKVSQAPASTLIDVTGVVWTKEGVPRLSTTHGFISAVKTHITPVRPDFEKFFYQAPERVRARVELDLYNSVDFNETTKIGSIAKGRILNVASIEWTAKGTPKLKVEGGYVSAYKKHVTTKLAVEPKKSDAEAGKSPSEPKEVRGEPKKEKAAPKKAGAKQKARKKSGFAKVIHSLMPWRANH